MLSISMASHAILASLKPLKPARHPGMSSRHYHFWDFATTTTLQHTQSAQRPDHGVSDSELSVFGRVVEQSPCVHYTSTLEVSTQQQYHTSGYTVYPRGITSSTTRLAGQHINQLLQPEAASGLR